MVTIRQVSRTASISSMLACGLVACGVGVSRQALAQWSDPVLSDGVLDRIRTGTNHDELLKSAARFVWAPPRVACPTTSGTPALRGQIGDETLTAEIERLAKTDFEAIFPGEDRPTNHSFGAVLRTLASSIPKGGGEASEVPGWFTAFKTKYPRVAFLLLEFVRDADFYDPEAKPWNEVSATAVADSFVFQQRRLWCRDCPEIPRDLLNEPILKHWQAEETNPDGQHIPPPYLNEIATPVFLRRSDPLTAPEAIERLKRAEHRPSLARQERVAQKLVKDEITGILQDQKAGCVYVVHQYTLEGDSPFAVVMRESLNGGVLTTVSGSSDARFIILRCIDTLVPVEDNGCLICLIGVTELVAEDKGGKTPAAQAMRETWWGMKTGAEEALEHR